MGSVAYQRTEEKNQSLFSKLGQLKVIYETGLFDEEEELLNEWKSLEGEFERKSGKGVGKSGEAGERRVPGEVVCHWVEMLKKDSLDYKNCANRYVRVAASLSIGEYDKKEVRYTINKLMPLLITTGKVHELTDHLEKLVEWIIRKKRSEIEAFSAMKDMRAINLFEGSKELQVVMHKWTTIMGEDEISTSHFSEEWVDVRYKDDVADYDTIDLKTLEGEHVRVVFNTILDHMCKSEAVKRVGMDMRKMFKKVFQEHVKVTSMESLMKQWAELCGKIRRLRGQVCQEEMEEDMDIEQEEGQVTMLGCISGVIVERIETKKGTEIKRYNMGVLMKENRRVVHQVRT